MKSFLMHLFPLFFPRDQLHFFLLAVNSTESTSLFSSLLLLGQYDYVDKRNVDKRNVDKTKCRQTKFWQMKYWQTKCWQTKCRKMKCQQSKCLYLKILAIKMSTSTCQNVDTPKQLTLYLPQQVINWRIGRTVKADSSRSRGPWFDTR